MGGAIDCCVDDSRNSQSHFCVGIWLVLCRCPHGDALIYLSVTRSPSDWREPESVGTTAA